MERTKAGRGYNDGVYIHVRRRRTPTRSREMTEFATARSTLPDLRAALLPRQRFRPAASITVDAPQRTVLSGLVPDNLARLTNPLDGVRSSLSWHSNDVGVR